MTTQASYFNPKMLSPVKELLSPDVLANPFPWFKMMRETSPVRYDADRDTWDVFVYDLALRVLQDTQTFSSSRMPPQARISQSMVFMDPPRHTQLRNLVTKAFTPKRISDFEPRITEITNELLAKLPASGEMDIVRDLGVPLPVTVIAELIGIPEEDQMAFKVWSDTFTEVAEALTPEAIEATIVKKNKAEYEFATYLEGLMEKRRQDPQPDMLSVLLQAEVEGKRLEPIEVIAFCIVLLVAGNETTTHLITHGVRCLIEHPEVLAQLRERPELINPFIEEVLRYTSPASSIERVATVDTELLGHQIKAGQGVAVWTGSCNHDPAKFAEPEKFLISRDPNPHIAFGFGVHFCLGAPLARLEAQLALGEIVKRFSKIEYANDAKLEPVFSTLIHGFKSLPIRFES